MSALESEERRESSVTAARPSMVAVLPPLETVEEKGSTMLLEAESLGDLHVRYKFLYSSLSDLKLKDLGPLLQVSPIFFYETSYARNALTDASLTSLDE